jgi:methylenetetrahydrofolate dehydrogenase (NADP+)/methenyltetrahydrofolate cyclohydrolase
MLLYGKPVVKKLLQETKSRVATHASDGSYVAFLLASDDHASAVYIAKKQAYAKRCGLWSHLFHNPEASLADVLAQIEVWNTDSTCLGIVVQLPLHKALKEHQAQILRAIDPLKDVDGLTGTLFGLHLTQVVNFLPATPKAIYELIDFYGKGELTGKVIAMIWQSNLIGKPFVLEGMFRGATVLSANSRTSKDILKDICQRSDLIVTATWVVGLLTPELFAWKDLSDKVIVDVGYGIQDGKACGDSDRQWLADLGASITPVPWGVGPVTVACLFHNLIALDHIRRNHLLG